MDGMELASLSGMRFHVYGVMRHVFSEYPDDNSLDVVFGGLTRESLSFFAAGGNRELVEAVEGYSALSETLDRGMLPSLRNSFTELFVGPGALPAPLWESVYTSPKKLLFQKSTLDVRKSYADEGYRFAGYPVEPDDCLGAELDFLKNLAARMSSALEVSDFKEAFRLADSQIAFLEGHLLAWVDEFSKNVHEAGLSDYYEAMAKLLVAYLRFDVQLLAEIKDALPRE